MAKANLKDSLTWLNKWLLLCLTVAPSLTVTFFFCLTFSLYVCHLYKFSFSFSLIHSHTDRQSSICKTAQDNRHNSPQTTFYKTWQCEWNSSLLSLVSCVSHTNRWCGPYFNNTNTCTMEFVKNHQAHTGQDLGTHHRQAQQKWF